MTVRDEGADGPRPGVSVVVPTFRGREHIATCLRSLAVQTLPPDGFEVVVVVNGPPDGTGEVLDGIRMECPDLDLRVLSLARPGASRARNAGIAAAGRAYTTFVDDDDTVSPGYLATLLAHAGPMVVSFGQLVDVGGGGQVEPATAINLQTIRYAGQTVHPERVPRALGFNAGKLIPTNLVKSVRYDTTLDSGVDVVFFMTLLAYHDFRVAVCPIDNGPDAANAVYYRLLRPQSMSRRDGFEFTVLGRLEVIARLDRLLVLADEPRRRVLRTTIRAQTGFLERYLRAHPDEAERVRAAIAGYAIPSLTVENLFSRTASPP
jgi:poly(ribitol-phosphate) beta-N-acetylglucosaminyltransferase